MANEFRIYHVTRRLGHHNSMLDDALYGSPEKREPDWAVTDPVLYVQRVKGELSRVNTALDDLIYVLREKGIAVSVPSSNDLPSLEEAHAHVFHRFQYRSFTYAEKIGHLLESHCPEDIELNISKAMRQRNMLIAAREDLMATLVRFTAYAENKQ